jgi:hypothetical protein
LNPKNNDYPHPFLVHLLRAPHNFSDDAKVHRHQKIIPTSRHGRAPLLLAKMYIHVVLRKLTTRFNEAFPSTDLIFQLP